MADENVFSMLVEHNNWSKYGSVIQVPMKTALKSYHKLHKMWHFRQGFYLFYFLFSPKIVHSKSLMKRNQIFGGVFNALQSTNGAGFRQNILLTRKYYVIVFISKIGKIQVLI